MAPPPPNYVSPANANHTMANVHEQDLQKFVQDGTSLIVVYDSKSKDYVVSVTRPGQDGITFRESRLTFPSNEMVAKIMMVG